MSEPARAGHGDHWLAALGESDPRLMDAIAVPADASEALQLRRSGLTETLDMVQVTARRRLVTAYPEPRATALVALRPRELLLWETGVEAWFVGEHDGAGALTFFLTDLAHRAPRYQAAKGSIVLELGAVAYSLQRAAPGAGPSRLKPAARTDARFLPDDYWFEADVRGVRGAGQSEVLDLEFQGGLVVPVATRRPTRLAPGERAQGFLWLTGRWPEEEGS